jgi:hypothetical protein
MVRANRISLVVALTVAFALFMVGAVLVQPRASAAPVNSMENEWTGVIMTRPVGVAGTWVVSTMSFQALSTTVLLQPNGPLNVGACALVIYHMSNGVNIAQAITSLPPNECQTGGDHDHMGELKVYSYVNALPAGFPITLTGDWVVGNMTFTAVITTQFEQDNGAFAVGKCVGVDYISGTHLLALEIETAPNYKCLNILDMPHAVTHGILDSFPTGLVGTWIVSGTAYSATVNTLFMQEQGAFLVGGCVEVIYNPNDMTAWAIRTDKPARCQGARPVERKFFGVVQSAPTDTVGTWVVGTMSFTVNSATRIETEHGPITVGACVEVEYIVSGADNVATEISADDMWKCNGNTYTNVAIGAISSFPPGLYGTWVITRHGDMTDTFEAVTTTVFDQQAGSFAAGVCVKVKYLVQNGVNQAVEIEALGPNICAGTEPPEHENMNLVFATIGQFPTGTPPVGLWIIGSVNYSATARTKFDQNHGAFAVGACVKALYQVVSDTNVLFQVQTKDADKCIISGTQVFRSFGVIDSFPANLIGDWNIGGISYTTNISTAFEQEHGFFAVGAYVQVKYILSDTTRLALGIETHVAPGAGRQDVLGVLQAHNMNDDWSPWVVNGVTYQADPAIQVNGTNLQIGQMVRLNVYHAADGTPYVTLISTPHQVFLPLVMR